MPCGGSTLAR
eukprot:SM012390S25730  [mRNA]  locus=s12390:65:307:+ [translate_table: standard]